ncbi:MAG: hypothetical protein IJI35_04535, partial [Kiritimatiellae bacterium]|nr:hypothetical protein [Kiritimatiellia bacterium]
EELASGIRLAVGAARTKVFELRPAVDAPKIAVRVKPSDLALEFAARRERLRAAADADAREEAASPLPVEDAGRVL